MSQFCLPHTLPSSGIDLATQRLIPLSDVPKLKHLPRRPNGKRHHVATIYRWAQRGLGGVRLETLKVGGTTCTSIEALQRFFERISEPQQLVTLPAPPASRRREADRAARDAEAILGLGEGR